MINPKKKIKNKVTPGETDLSYAGNHSAVGTTTPTIQQPPPIPEIKYNNTQEPEIQPSGPAVPSPEQEPTYDTVQNETGSVGTEDKVTTGETVPTYAEWLQQQKEEAYRTAEVNREKAIIDAANSYEANKATYGAKAEALASMGLTGSGYSDFIDAQAYATKRSEIQGAYAREEEAKRLAESTYAENSMLYREGGFNSILEGIVNGTYTKDQIEELASQYGLSEEQKTTLIESATNKVFGTILQQVQDGTYSAEDIENLVSQNGFTDSQKQLLKNAAAQYSELKAEADEGKYMTNYYGILKDLKDDPSAYSAEEIDQMAADKLISPEYAEKLKTYASDSLSKAAIEDIDYLIKGGDAIGAIEAADKAYNNGNGTISKDQWQKTYFDASLINCQNVSTTAEYYAVKKDLENLHALGKLTGPDYQSLIKTLATTQGTLLKSVITKSTYESITIDNKSYKLKIDYDPIDPATNAMLNEILKATGEYAQYQFALLDGKVYRYEGAGQWYRVRDKDGLYEDVKDVAEGIVASTPTHKLE